MDTNSLLGLKFVETYPGEIRRKYKIVINLNSKILILNQMNTKDRNYIFSSIDPKVNNNSSMDEHVKVYDILQNNIILGKSLISGQIGWIIDKEMPSNKDMSYTTLGMGPNVDLVRPHVKEAIEQAKLTGGYFQPVWIKEIKDIEIPDYFTLSSTHGIDALAKRTEDKVAQLLPKSVESTLLDLNYLKYGPDGNELSIIAPETISQRAYQVLKKFRKPGFFPVVFE